MCIISRYVVGVGMLHDVVYVYIWVYGLYGIEAYAVGTVWFVH